MTKLEFEVIKDLLNKSLVYTMAELNLTVDEAQDFLLEEARELLTMVKEESDSSWEISLTLSDWLAKLDPPIVNTAVIVLH